MGWNLAERRAWHDRGSADFLLALALVHHLVIGGNVPLRSVVERLAAAAPAGVVEFVEKDDDMVRSMLANREDVFADYSREAFEEALSQHFALWSRETINRGTRVLYSLRPK